eukprot:9321081-Pyramimonas_sp.AAC.1
MRPRAPNVDRQPSTVRGWVHRHTEDAEGTIQDNLERIGLPMEAMSTFPDDFPKEIKGRIALIGTLEEPFEVRALSY